MSAAPVPLLVVNVVSLVPSVFKRTIRPTVVPFQAVNSPPTRILPSDWIAIALIMLVVAPVPLLVVNVVSLVPSEFKRTIRPTVVPFQERNRPPTSILPSD